MLFEHKIAAASDQIILPGLETAAFEFNPSANYKGGHCERTFLISFDPHCDYHAKTTIFCNCNQKAIHILDGISWDWYEKM